MGTLPDISDHLHMKQGYCYPDWDAVSLVIEENLPEPEWNLAWETAARSWVQRMRENLGGDYQVYETSNFMILSEAPMRIIENACKSCEEALRKIIVTLNGVASDEGYGKHVVLMFASIDDYYGYIDYFLPEGDHPMSGGMCLSGEGYVHFAFPATDYSSYRTVLVHELTHGCLAHLPLPMWLNEALAMRMEELICGSAIFHLDQEIYDKHTAHWTEETIQQFWTGESWGIPGDSFELSYNLAQVLWRKIEVDLAVPHVEILKFIMDTHSEDAGEAACLTFFELSLGDLVLDFLGEGDWAPEPMRWSNQVLKGS